VTSSAKFPNGSKAAGQVFRSTWWTLELPQGWIHQEELECISFSNDPPLGVLRVSAARNPTGNATLQDLYDFATDFRGFKREFQTLNSGKPVGIFAQYVEGELFWGEWLLMSGPIVVYLTYNVLAALQGSETMDVRRIVESTSIYS